MDNLLAVFLGKHGPQLSGPLAEALAVDLGISATAARQRLARHAYPVKRLNLPFAKGALFYYVAQQFGTDLFWKRLGDALESNNGAYSRVVRALSARGGIIPLSHFAAAVGCSSGQRQLSADEVFRRLLDVRLVEELEIPGLGQSVAFAKGATFIDDELPSIKARLICEDVLLEHIKEWAAKLGLGSFHSFQLRGGSVNAVPNVSSIAWDMTAPSYLTHLANWSGPKPKPGFLTVDLLLKTEITASDIAPFLYKCTTLRKSSSARCLHFFVAHHYSEKALHEIKRAGVVPATISSLFGTEVAKALLELANVLREAAARSVDLGKFDELFRRLGKVEGASGRLRGALFEFLVAEVVRAQCGDAARIRPVTPY